MSKEKKPLNEGYQQTDQRGYQPEPNDKFGYQPSDKRTTPPDPPTSDSNASSPKKA